jgi:hypothetical protein
MKETSVLMSALLRLAADNRAELHERMMSGERAIKTWAAQAGKDHAERGRMLEVLKKEIAPMATREDFWGAMRDAVTQQLNQPNSNLRDLGPDRGERKI